MGGHFSIFPTLCAQIFGPQSGGKVYTALFSAFATGTIVNFVLTNQSGEGKSLEYEVLFYILASMAVTSFISALFLKIDTKVKQKTQKQISQDDSSDFKVGANE